MTFIRSFSGYYPPKRFDGLPFTAALIQEAAEDEGPWTTIQTTTLTPVDVNPAEPQVRDLTTTLATLPVGWYRVVWRDAAMLTFPSEGVIFPSDGGAHEQLARMVAADSAPELDDEEVDDLLAAVRLIDPDCNLPTDVVWTPTYDLNAAAAEGWRRKAGKVAGCASYSADGLRVDRGALTDHCLAMSRVYRAKVIVSVPLRGRRWLNEWDWVGA